MPSPARPAGAATRADVLAAATTRFRAGERGVHTLACAIVRLYEAFVYNDAAAGIRGEVDRLRDVDLALLGIAPATPRSQRRSGLRAGASARPG